MRASRTGKMANGAVSRPNGNGKRAAKTVLVVDDDREVTHILARALQQWGYTSLQANSAADAVRIAREKPVDAALVDVRMPDMNGFLLLRQLRKGRSSTVFVMMTGYSELEDARRAMKMGAYDYLTKPFELESLRVVLKAALGGKGALRYPLQ